MDLPACLSPAWGMDLPACLSPAWGMDAPAWPPLTAHVQLMLGQQRTSDFAERLPSRQPHHLPLPPSQPLPRPPAWPLAFM
eukprot:363371-Chlamydomonas_euryale.AAC.1